MKESSKINRIQYPEIINPFTRAELIWKLTCVRCKGFFPDDSSSFGLCQDCIRDIKKINFDKEFEIKL